MFSEYLDHADLEHEDERDVNTASQWQLQDPFDITLEDSQSKASGSLDPIESTSTLSDLSRIPLTVEETAAVSEQPSTSQSMRIVRYKQKFSKESGDAADTGNQPSKKGARKVGSNAKRSYLRKPQARKLTAWEFLLKTITNPAHNPSVLQWKNKKTGEFRIVQGQTLANLWAKHRGYKTKIKYESFARGLRYYYKKGYIGKRSGAKLLYQFREKCNWRKFIEQHKTFGPPSHCPPSKRWGVKLTKNDSSSSDSSTKTESSKQLTSQKEEIEASDSESSRDDVATTSAS